jgi:ABC-type uncharacterized transport system substrate-binding protein
MEASVSETARVHGAARRRSGAAAWPLAAHAQQRERMRHIGVLMNLTADDPQSPMRIAAFAQGLEQLGWTLGGNVQIDYRWAAGNLDRSRVYAAELVSLAPDVIFAVGALAVGPLQQVSRTVPIVFAGALIQLVLDLSPAWRGRAVTPPGSPFLNTESAQSGWNC